MRRSMYALSLATALAITSFSWAANSPNANGGGGGGGGATTYTLTGVNTRVQIDSTYAYRVYDKTTGALLLSRTGTTFVIGGKSYTTSNLTKVTVTGTTLNGTLAIASGKTTSTAQVALTLAGDTLAVDYTRPGLTAATSVTETFADSGEHYYGLWEHAYTGSIDNRGVTKPYAGTELFDANTLSPVSDVGGVYASSARAPFYMTTKNIGVYTPTEAQGSYTLGVSSATSETFNVPELHYQVYHGASLAGVMGMYNQAAGPARLPPLWAFDSIWWRDDSHAIPTGSAATNAQSLIVEDATKLQQYQIPAGAIWIDRPYGSNTGSRDSNVGGWGNMDFEPAAFPTPNQMVKDLNDRGLHTMLWVANKANCNLYSLANSAGYLFNGYSNSPALDLRKPEAGLFMQGQLETLMNAARIYPGPGIFGFKIDRGGEGEMPTAQINQLTTLMQQTAHDALETQVGDRYFAFARNINDTGRQYAAVWSGDPDTTFQAFQTSLINGIRSGMINFPMWGSDVGGYSGSAPSKELYARWFGFGAYSPMMEVMQMPGRTIWFDYDGGATGAGSLVALASAAAKTHHDLIPYTYSLAAQNTLTGVPILRAMVLEFPTDTKVQTLGTQYMFGPGLLVAPVVAAGATSRSVYFPAGHWLDYNNRTTHYTSTGATTSVAAPVGTVPVFVREGAIIPRGDILQSNNNWSWSADTGTVWTPALRIECFPAITGTSSFSYYDGTGFSTIACTTTAGVGIHITADNLTYAGVLDVYCSPPTTVTLNTKVLVPVTDYTYDTATKLLHVPCAAGAVTLDLAGSGSIWP